MKITITVPKRVEQALKREVKEWAGRRPTEAEMVRFFRRDIRELYFELFEDNLAEAVEGTWKPRRDG